MLIIIWLPWHLPFRYPRGWISPFCFVMLNPFVHFYHFLSSISCHHVNQGRGSIKIDWLVSFQKLLNRVYGLLILYMNQVWTKNWLVANGQQKPNENPNHNKNLSGLCSGLLGNIMILLIFFNSSSNAHYNVYKTENCFEFWLLKLITYFCALFHLLIHLTTWHKSCQL